MRAKLMFKILNDNELLVVDEKENKVILQLKHLGDRSVLWVNTGDWGNTNISKPSIYEDGKDFEFILTQINKDNDDLTPTSDLF